MLRTALFFITFVPWTLFVIATGLPLSLIRADWLHSYARFWARTSLGLAGVSLRIEGQQHLPRQGAVIYMPNHQSNFDILALFAGLPGQFRWLAKEELFRIPLFGLAMRRAGYIAVDRSNRRKSVESMKIAIERISQGTSVLIFPEGTRSPDGRLGAFKTGSFTLALQAQVPIVPVAIHGSRDIMAKKSCWIRGGAIRVEILPAVPTAGRPTQDRQVLLEQVRGDMLATLEGAAEA